MLHGVAGGRDLDSTGSYSTDLSHIVLEVHSVVPLSLTVCPVTTVLYCPLLSLEYKSGLSVVNERNPTDAYLESTEGVH
jgi:hypothetical protein